MKKYRQINVPWEAIYRKVDWVIYIVNVMLCHTCNPFFSERSRGGAVSVHERVLSLLDSGAGWSACLPVPFCSRIWRVSSVFFLHFLLPPWLFWASSPVRELIGRNRWTWQWCEGARSAAVCVIVSEARAVIAVSHAVLSHQRRFYLRLLDGRWRYSS